MEHIVKYGDTLSHLALKYYGDALKWTPIYVANAEEIHKEQDRRGYKRHSPDRIFPGQKLIIPNK